MTEARPNTPTSMEMNSDEFLEYLEMEYQKFVNEVIKMIEDKLNKAEKGEEIKHGGEPDNIIRECSKTQKKNEEKLNDEIMGVSFTGGGGGKQNISINEITKKYGVSKK